MDKEQALTNIETLISQASMSSEVMILNSLGYIESLRLKSLISDDESSQFKQWILDETIYTLDWLTNIDLRTA